MGMILAGGDMKQVSLYYLDSDGTRTTGKVFSVGSGSLFAYGVLDSGYRWELPDDEAYGKLQSDSEAIKIIFYSLFRAWPSFNLPRNPS